MSQATHSRQPTPKVGRKKGSKRPHQKIGKVPAKYHAYILPFMQYVVDSYEGDPTNQSRAQKCSSAVEKFLNEHWDAFYQHVETTRPKKKARTEQPYNESKLTRDTKTIVTKLEAIHEAIPNLNPDEAHENIDQIYLTVNQIRRGLTDDGGENGSPSELVPVSQLPPIPPAHSLIPPTSGHSFLAPAESTGTQSLSTSESSMSGPQSVSAAPVAQ